MLLRLSIRVTSEIIHACDQFAPWLTQATRNCLPDINVWINRCCFRLSAHLTNITVKLLYWKEGTFTKRFARNHVQRQSQHYLTERRQFCNYSMNSKVPLCVSMAKQKYSHFHVWSAAKWKFYTDFKWQDLVQHSFTIKTQNEDVASTSIHRRQLSHWK